jgi:hypothetical protein
MSTRFLLSAARTSTAIAASVVGSSKNRRDDHRSGIIGWGFNSSWRSFYRLLRSSFPFSGTTIAFSEDVKNFLLGDGERGFILLCAEGSENVTKH